MTDAKLDPDYPGCLSKKVVQGLLRDEIGYDGMVISDSLEVRAIWDVYGFAQGTILTVNAGIDLMLFCNHSPIVPYSDERAEAAIEVIADAVARGEIAESRIDEACSRILRLKSRLV